MKTKKELEKIGIKKICKNLYLLNKEAKQESGKRQSQLYQLKNEIIETLKKRKLAELQGYHKVGEYKKYNSYIGYAETHNLNANLCEVIDEAGTVWQYHIRGRASGNNLGELLNLSENKEKIAAKGNANIILLNNIAELDILSKNQYEKESMRKKKKHEKEAKLHELEITNKIKIANKNKEKLEEITKSQFYISYNIGRYTMNCEFSQKTFSLITEMKEIKQTLKTKIKEKKEREKKQKQEQIKTEKEISKINEKIKKQKRTVIINRIWKAAIYSNVNDTIPYIQIALRLSTKQLQNILQEIPRGYGRERECRKLLEQK